MGQTAGYFAALGMILVGVGFIVVLVRSGRGRPRDAFQVVGIGLSSLLVVVALLLLGLLLLAPPPSTGATAANEGLPQVAESELNRPAPDFSFQLLEGGAESVLSDYQGRVVLLNFWATWCGPCRIELPDLNRLQDRYGPEGLVVLTISDEPAGDLVAFERTMPLQTVVGYIPSADVLPDPFRRTLAVRPSTYIVDRDGLLRSYTLGAGSYETFEQAITPYL